MSRVFKANERAAIRLRSDLNGKLLEDLREAWLAKGKQALLDFAKDDPGGFVKTFASLLPKQAQLEVTGDAPTVIFDFRGREASERDPITVEEVLEEAEEAVTAALDALPGDGLDLPTAAGSDTEGAPAWASEEHDRPW
jgi:hypothetical protein